MYACICGDLAEKKSVLYCYFKNIIYLCAFENNIYFFCETEFEAKNVFDGWENLVDVAPSWQLYDNVII